MTASDRIDHDEHPRNDLALAEAALFLASQPLTRRALAKILGGVALAYVDQLLEDLKEQFDDPGRGIELHVEDGRALFRVKPVYVNQVAHLAPQQDIPRPILRTLAVIAYNHPMTQADLIKVRGNKGYGHVQELLERGLISSEAHGRTLLLSITRDFLRHFGLNSVEEFRFHFADTGIDKLEEDEEDRESHDAEAQGAEHQDSEIQDDSEAAQEESVESARTELLPATEPRPDESRQDDPESDMDKPNEDASDNDNQDTVDYPRQQETEEDEHG